MRHSNVIDIRGLNSYYGNRHVLFDIHFAIPANRITVIMGVSGCGKTTLLRHLIGLKPSPPGRLLVDGEDMGGFNEARMNQYRSRIGVLFQSGALFNSMSVADNVSVPLRVHSKLSRETIRIIATIKLHQVGLSEYCDYMPSQLSGGMQKRAGLARAMAMDPEILFVDEPSSGLDPITAAGLDNLILELRDTLGMTIIVVTHELESALHIADQIVVLDKGRLLAAGSPENIQSSQDERVVQFLQRQADQKHEDTEAYIKALVGRKLRQL
ncbi:ABC transporter ATP-binding protein [Desulfoferrobacter suflitae]|uniref:ABC transporter ATP-binding protein n=1 Tax=Desulfoferrobacter suflitae TaxID=2865782 RepID=UPI00216439A7|nr:ATP-binding cassette domain-containing protein [Desulfoferrobacter suflitae]MCK8603072.1 ATP-binding cassette domain-containing protein [Desulfoferrobacter suflitae]